MKSAERLHRCFDRLSRLLVFAITLGVSLGMRAAEPAARPLHLFLLAGQSNMAGRGEIDPQDNAPLAHVRVLQRDGSWAAATEPYHYDKAVAGAGLARSFAQAYLADHPGVDVGFIPAACGGSSLAAWQAGFFFEQTRGHPWDDALLRTRRARMDGELQGILWHQGESDSHPETAGTYEAGLTSLIARFRTALDAPTLPVVIGQTGRFSDEPLGPSVEQIDAANRAIASRDEKVAYVTAEGLGAKADGIHFNTTALREFGRRYYAAFLTLAVE